MNFDKNVIIAVRNKGKPILGLNPLQYRLDQCGAIIEWKLYGNRDSKGNSGREIDHIVPVSKGGTDHISNLRPLQWYNNLTKSNGKLNCPMKRSRS